MPLVIIHGEDTVKTRQELTRVITASKAKGYQDIVQLHGATLSLDELLQNMESHSFFSDTKRLTVIEDLHKMKSKTNLKEILEYLSTDGQPYPCVLWESKELTATQLKKFPEAKVIVAKVSAIIFKLTDELLPHTNPTKLLPLLSAACANDTAEMVLVMLTRQIRMMLQTFDPNAKLPPWQKAKLTKAAQGFGQDKLITMHHQLAQIDTQNKTGQLASTLQSELEQWFIQVLL